MLFGTEITRTSQANGTAEPCIATTMMENAMNRKDADLAEERIYARDVSALAYAGACRMAHTVDSALTTVMEDSWRRYCMC